MNWKHISIGLLTIIVSFGILTFILVKTQPAVLGTISPIPDEDTRESEQYRMIFERKTTDNYPPNTYFPKNLISTYTDDIGINAEAYAVMERGSKELLFAKNLTVQLPIASITKIMTAVVARKKGKLDQELTVDYFASHIGEAVMGLSEGETVTVEDLLHGIMLPSGNDAAETLAEGLGKGRSAFIKEMNEEALRLGLFDTYFFNPTGLDGDDLKTTSFSTSLDLLALTNYALNDGTFAKIVATYEKIIPYVEGKHKAFFLYNILQFDRAYPGIKGVKPGITDFAGETLVSYAENGGRQIIVVLLGTQNSKDEVVKLYDYIFGKLGVEVVGR